MEFAVKNEFEDIIVYGDDSRKHSVNKHQLVSINELEGNSIIYNYGTKIRILKQHILTGSKYVWQVSSAFRLKYVDPTLTMQPTITNYCDWCSMGLCFVYGQNSRRLYGTQSVIEVPEDCRVKSEKIKISIILEDFQSYFDYNCIDRLFFPENYTTSEYLFDGSIIGLSQFKRDLDSHFIFSTIGEWNLKVRVLAVQEKTYAKYRTKYRTHGSKPSGYAAPLASCRLNTLVFSDESSYFILHSGDGFKVTYCLAKYDNHIKMFPHILLSVNHQISMKQVYPPDLDVFLVVGDRDVTMQ